LDKIAISAISIQQQDNQEDNQKNNKGMKNIPKMIDVSFLQKIRKSPVSFQKNKKRQNSYRVPNFKKKHKHPFIVSQNTILDPSLALPFLALPFGEGWER
jgi:hypothetical protein